MSPRRLVVLLSVRWGYLWQRHQALASAAAERGWDVHFVQPRPRNVRQLLSFPWRRFRGRRLEQQDRGHHGVTVHGAGFYVKSGPSADLVLVYLPDWISWMYLKVNRPSACVYDAVLDWEHVPRWWYPPLAWRSAERKIANQRNSKTITDSSGMSRILQTLGHFESRCAIELADHSFAHFRWKNYFHKERVILYFGLVREEVDIDVLTALSSRGSGWM